MSDFAVFIETGARGACEVFGGRTLAIRAPGEHPTQTKGRPRPAKGLDGPSPSASLKTPPTGNFPRLAQLRHLTPYRRFPLLGASHPFRALDDRSRR